MSEIDSDTLQEIWLMVRSLVKTPPIFYDEDEQQYFCKCCFSSIERTPDTIQPSDAKTFPHQRTCPVARAQRIEAKLRARKS